MATVVCRSLRRSRGGAPILEPIGHDRRGRPPCLLIDAPAESVPLPAVLNSWPLPHSPPIAIDGLRRAVTRVDNASGGVLAGGGGSPVWIALSEALYWVAALDDYAEPAVADYFPRRDNDADGRVAAGLVYARNRHAHEVVSTAEAAFEIPRITITMTPAGQPSPPPGRGTLFSVQLRWTPLAELPSSGAVERRGRDKMYDERVAGRPLGEPFGDAVRWFERVFGEQYPFVRRVSESDHSAGTAPASHATEEPP